MLVDAPTEERPERSLEVNMVSALMVPTDMFPRFTPIRDRVISGKEFFVSISP